VRKLAVGLVLVILAAACGGNDAPAAPVIPASFTFKGDIRLSGAKYVSGELSECSGVGPYVDIYKGARVTVTNEVGKPIAIGTVAYGLGTNYYRDILDECTFRFYVPSVPRAKAYLVYVGRNSPHTLTLPGVVQSQGVFSYDINTPLVVPRPQT
jgi:hypothetical protein